MIDIRQSPEYAKYMASIGWYVERVNNTNYFIKKIPLIGSFIKIQRPEKINIININKLIKKHRAFQIIVEPKNKSDKKILLENKYKPTSPFVPSKTLQLNLTKSQKNIYKQFKKDCRYALRKTENIIVSEELDINKFRNNWKKAVPYTRYVMSLNNLEGLKKSFGENCLFLTAGLPRCSSKGAEAGAIFLCSNNIAYYWQAFTNKNARKELVQYKIVWEGILWAKKKGATRFDFEGIYDNRFPNKKWEGFTHFKKSFNGSEIEFPGAFSRRSFLKW